MANTVLVRGSEYLAKHPEFRLEGRAHELERLSSILMRKSANSVLLVGPGGVGCTALCLGLQARKSDPDAPFDIVVKRLFWLDTDKLFASGDAAEIHKTFQTMLRHLKQTPQSILIIEDTRDFIDAARAHSASHFFNSLNLAVKNNETQVILEVRDDDLDIVLKCHSDMRECYTMMDLTEPVGENLNLIVRQSAAHLIEHHGISISDEALMTAIDLTNKYRTRDIGLSRAQPERSITLVDRALSTYRLNAHKQSPKLAPLLAEKANAIDDRIRASVDLRIKDAEEEWDRTQAELKRLSMAQRDGEQGILDLEERLASIQAEEAAKGETGERASSRISTFASMASASGLESDQVRAIKDQIKAAHKAVEANRAAFDAIADEINKALRLTRDHVLAEFSLISGIPANKLNADEREKLRNLEGNLLKRIFGQDHAVKRLSDAIKKARVGRRNANQPQAAFMFLGPSGVGKTEIAKALATILLDDEKALARFDMSEYMEKHAVAKLIGAPPGYEGFEAGGILTNTARRNPYQIYLFDEIEKAHPDVFNVFLQILSDGRLTDNVGRTVSFSESIILMTSNTGQSFFLDESLSTEEAEAGALADLGNIYRSEFLNRFAGRQNIVCFHRLALPIIERIVRREFDSLSAAYLDKGVGIQISDADIAAFCRDHYSPMIGARGLPGYIGATIEPVITNALLDHEDLSATLVADYDPVIRQFATRFEPLSKAA